MSTNIDSTVPTGRARRLSDVDRCPATHDRNPFCLLLVDVCCVLLRSASECFEVVRSGSKWFRTIERDALDDTRDR